MAERFQELYIASSLQIIGIAEGALETIAEGSVVAHEILARCDQEGIFKSYSPSRESGKVQPIIVSPHRVLRVACARASPYNIKYGIRFDNPQALIFPFKKFQRIVRESDDTFLYPFDLSQS